jgi:2'-5' RNA ligase
MIFRKLFSHRRRSVFRAKKSSGMVRLKLYLVPDEQTIQFCCTVNAGIRRLTDSAIVFGTDSPMIPHITLATGFLVPPHTIEELTSVTKRLAQRMKPLTLGLGQPYLEPVHEGYVLCGIEEHQDLQTLTKQVSETMRGAFPLMRDLRSTIGAHITLAHIDAQYDEVHTYLQSVKVPPQVVCTHIEIARCGEHGTCIDRLFGCDLAIRQNEQVEEAQ